jgi:RimJ/RimL family protein N-acetyltransferase
MATPIRTTRLDLIPLDPAALRHLIAGDRAAAQRILGLTLPPDFPTDDERAGFLPIQLHRMEASPQRRDWMARLIVSEPDGVIGHCGFHGPPNIIGRAEIGYTVFEPFRGQGFAKEAATALVRWAFEQGEKEVYASVSPNNAPSLAVINALGFTQVGTQEDEVDGLELVFAIRPDQQRGR